MTDRLVIALAQANPTVGDVDGNVSLALGLRAEAAAGGADLVIFSEMFVSGYPPEDLVLKPSFQEDVARAVQELAGATADGGPAILVGAPWRDDGGLFNAALLLEEGAISAIRYKHDLPNYGPFDERRLFQPGSLPGPVAFKGVPLGVMICEDMWLPDVAECLEETGAELLLSLNASPFELGKADQRLSQAVARIRETGLPLVYLNQAGGQDELVFDGGSFVLNSDCGLAVQMAHWRDGLALTHWRRGAEGGWSCEPGEQVAPPERPESIYQAMMLGLRDYTAKNGFSAVVIGLSGGIDSSLTSTIAVDALGAENVHPVMLPSRYTRASSLEDAEDVARRLGVELQVIPIEPAVEAFGGMLAELFEGRAENRTEENIQPRTRATVLMALSNKFGYMLLTTGNKSEMSTGYVTIYGDMCGGYSVLKDVYKTTCYELAGWRNANMPLGGLGPAGEVIPEHVLTKAPSAELKEDQVDLEALPPYDVLDPILERLVEREMSTPEIVAEGFDEETVRRVEHMLYVAEYKRRQAPPGVKITGKSFGRDRRYPITNGLTKGFRVFQ